MKYIDDNAMEAIGDMLQGLIGDHRKDLEEVMDVRDEVDVSIKIRFTKKPVKKRVNFDIESSISFITGRKVKGSRQTEINAPQMDMFPEMKKSKAKKKTTGKKKSAS